MTIPTWADEFEERFGDMLALVETHTGVSERENIKKFLAAKESECEEKCVDMLKKGNWLGDDSVARIKLGVLERVEEVLEEKNHRERGYILKQTTEKEEGWNECVAKVLAHLDSLKKELPEEITK